MPKKYKKMKFKKPKVKKYKMTSSHPIEIGGILYV